MRDLVLDLDPALGRCASLEDALRRAIRSGSLSPGAGLPSSRTVAADHGMSRATVVAAYEQLAVEGYLVARHGVGTQVADLRLPAAAPAPATPSIRRFRYDFRPGEPDGSQFPRAAWLRSVRRAVTDADDAAFGYVDLAGRVELRTALAAYLGRSRAVHAHPDAISVFGGLTASMAFLGECFRSVGIDRVAVEDPVWFCLRDALSLAGVDLLPVGIDHEGVRVDDLSETDVGAVLVGPAHQYPTGAVMSAARRTELIDWARSRDAWVVEDDYDGEFRYDRQPVGALQGLDPDRVIYAGTASKSLAPGLRLSWLVVPEAIRRPLATVKHLRGGVSSLDQLALADFIDRGELDRHLRKVRASYADREARLVKRLRDEVDWLDVPADRVGLHVTCTARGGPINEAEVVAAAAEQSIGLLGLAPHWMSEPTSSGLVIGHSRPPQHGFDQALDALTDFLVTCDH